MIFSQAQKTARLTEAGAQWIHYEAFTLEHAKMPAEAFPAWLKQKFSKLKSLHVGDNFRYGHQRLGDGAHLKVTAQALGLTVQLVPAVQLQQETVSSSRIRQALSQGELALANEMLLRPYEAEGIISPGRQLGRTIGFPTVNLAWQPELQPALGVYAVEVIHGSEALPAVANFGQRPTVENGPVAPILEAHILRGPAPTTGDHIRVRWLNYLRAEKKFPNLDALRAQIVQDTLQAQHCLGLMTEGLTR
jgi:riboflavin kinase/FMN adenylyltransferase